MYYTHYLTFTIPIAQLSATREIFRALENETDGGHLSFDARLNSKMQPCEPDDKDVAYATYGTPCTDAQKLRFETLLPNPTALKAFVDKDYAERNPTLTKPTLTAVTSFKTAVAVPILEAVWAKEIDPVIDPIKEIAPVDIGAAEELKP